MATGGDSPSSVTLYTDAAYTQAATVQQVIDAFSAGDVRILQTVNGIEAVVTVLSLVHQPGSGSGAAANLLVADPASDAVKTLHLGG
jgi:hypothetical protein